jgi:DNA helicase-2/ATP-dependent DNA helicase PcrA
VDAGAILEGLNPEQLQAVRAVRGPVCILAGAGSGKTTAITRRIAYHVASGAFEPSRILAVTFTDKAAGEMRQRLAELGVSGVEARTFHAAALAQLHAFGSEPPGQVLASKAPALRQIAASLPRAYRFRPLADLANEIEWAKNRRIAPAAYRSCLDDHEPPIPADLMAGVYQRYERGKERRGMVDFEDILELAVRLFDADPGAAARFRARYLAFTVDEYQDVNLLQQTLLERWLGGRDELCVVGDDYQSIYGFTGATPRYLIEMAERFPDATVVRLERNYRSSPQVLELANRLVPRLGGVPKRLRATRPAGPDPVVRAFGDAGLEVGFAVARIRDLQREGVPLEGMAVLYRVNFRSEEFEEALTAAGLPFQVRDGAFLGRPGARGVLRRLRDPSAAGVAGLVRAAAAAEGLLEEAPDGLGEQEATRQADLARLVRLAEELQEARPDTTVGAFLEDLRGRFASQGDGRGVNLLTYHRAKGLEFDAVFLPHLEEGELPFKRARSDEAVAEERRLLYVGLTRARRHLFLTWTAGSRKPSRFLRELEGDHVGGPSLGATRGPAGPRPEPGPVLVALRKWRLERARAGNVPAYVVFHDRVLEEIASRKPRDWADLAAIEGIGPVKLERYADEILDLLRRSG